MARSTVLLVAFCIYAVFSLFSMALMNIGAAVFLAALVFSQPAMSWKELKAAVRTRPVRMYLLASLALASACVLSLAGAHFFPVEYAGRSVPVQWGRDLAKLWYFILPVAVVIGLNRL